MENEFIKTIQNFTNVSNSIVNNGKNFNNFNNKVKQNLEVIVLHINELKKSIKKLKNAKQGIQQNDYKNNENIDNIKTDCESLKNKKLELEKEIKSLLDKQVQIINEKTKNAFNKNELKKMTDDDKNKIEQEIFNLEKENENILKLIKAHKKEPNEFYSSNILPHYNVNNNSELIIKIKHNEEIIEELQKLVYVIENDNDIKSLETQIHIYEEELNKVMIEYKNLHDKFEQLKNTNLKLNKLISEINETIKQVTQKLVSFQDNQHSAIKNNNETNAFIENINNTINEINSFITGIDMSSPLPILSQPNTSSVLTNKNINIDESNELDKNKIFEKLNVNNKNLYDNVLDKLNKDPNLANHNYVLNDITGKEIKLNLYEIITELFEIKTRAENDFKKEPFPEHAVDVIRAKKLIDKIRGADSIDEIQNILNSPLASIIQNHILSPDKNETLPPPVSFALPKKVPDTLNVSLHNAVAEEINDGLTPANKKTYTDIIYNLSEKGVSNLVSHYYTLIEGDIIKLNLPEIISGLLYYIQINSRMHKNSKDYTTQKYIEKHILDADDLIRKIRNGYNNVAEIQNILNNGNKDIFKELINKYKVQTEKKGKYNLELREDDEINYDKKDTLKVKILTLSEISDCLDNWIINNPTNYLRFNIENLKKKIDTKRITEDNLINTINNDAEIVKVLDQCYENKIGGGYKSKKSNKHKRTNKHKKYKKTNKHKKYKKTNKSQKNKVKKKKIIINCNKL